MRRYKKYIKKKKKSDYFIVKRRMKNENHNSGQKWKKKNIYHVTLHSLIFFVINYNRSRKSHVSLRVRSS